MAGRITNPTVSVIIPTYNRAHLIGRAIQSVLDQSYQDFELIVVDDGSTDNTEEVVNSFDDERIKYIRHEKNKGGAAARNTGIKIANGEYIGFLDDDDEWLADKLLKQLEAMENLSPDIWGGIYCGFYSVTNEKIIRMEATKQGNLKKEILKEEVDIGAASTLLFHRQAIKEIGLFDEDFERHQDWEFLIRFFRQYKLFSLKDPLVKVYGHNMPSAEKAAKAKEKYLSKFKGDIYEFGEEEAKDILARHWLEIHMSFARERRLRESLHYLKKSLSYKFLPPGDYLTQYLRFLVGSLSYLWKKLRLVKIKLALRLKGK